MNLAHEHAVRGCSLDGVSTMLMRYDGDVVDHGGTYHKNVLALTCFPFLLIFKRVPEGGPDMI